MKRLALVLVLTLVLLTAACTVRLTGAVPAELKWPNTQQTGLSVTGEGKVTYTPDIALINLGIEAQAKTVANAQEQARQAMSRVMAALEGKGVAEKDIQTRRFSIEPVREWVDDFPQRGKKEVIVGYRVTNLVTAKVRKIEEAGPIIDAVAEAGGDTARVQSISFTLDNPLPLYEQAREKAVKDAQSKAEQVARLTRIELGKPTYISESTPFTPKAYEARFEAIAAPAPTVISPGEMELTLNVYINYAIE